MLKNKKGIALNEAFGAVLTLVLLGVLVIVGILVFVNINSSFANTKSVSVTNETLTTVTEQGELVTNSALCGFSSFNLGIATNATTGGTIPTTNYTTSEAGLVSFVMGNSGGYNNSDWNVSYSFNWGSEACTAGADMVTQFATYPTLVGLVGTIIFLGLVIGVLVASFVFGRKSGI